MSFEYSRDKRKSLYDTARTPKEFEEPDVVPWAATPLDPIREQQDAVHAAFEVLYRHPFLGPPTEFGDLIEKDFFAGRAYRETVNMAHYREWLRRGGSHTEFEEMIIAKSHEPGVSPTELLRFVCESDIQATELGKLSVPYGYRLGQVPVLRAKVDTAIAAVGGRPLVGESYTHIRIAPHFDDKNDNALVGLLVTYQREVGLVPEKSVSVKERQALGIRVDKESGFPQDLRIELELTAFDGRRAAQERMRAAMKSVEQYIQDDEPS
ncbi:MAG TPA: hypothetical protein VFQ70_00325, partial [Candidatus Saccharimonadaceae bacterium]|nr:hypothetical protein [Candidatus Saccharimonadaceae bacterium]